MDEEAEAFVRGGFFWLLEKMEAFSVATLGDLLA